MGDKNPGQYRVRVAMNNRALPGVAGVSMKNSRGDAELAK